MLLAIIIFAAVAFGISIAPNNAGIQPGSQNTLSGFTILAISTLAVSLLVYLVFIKRILTKLDKLTADDVTDREYHILENISEGVVILDTSENVLVANKEFLSLVNKHMDDIKGQPINSMDWYKQPETMPWTQAIANSLSNKDIQLLIKLKDQLPKTVSVNAIPIKDENNQVDGVIVTIKDISRFLEQKEKYKKTMSELRETHKKFQTQNKTLKKMAMQDHLTGCYNRHAFFEIFEGEWSGAKRYGYDMSCILLDIDQLRKINDNHGHTTGDEVLRVVAGLIKDNIRKSDYVCRYSGEEFCILLPHTSIEDTAQTAEKIRLKVEESHPCDILTTMSIGLSSMQSNAKTPQELTNQADIAMQYSMLKGGNQHYRWDKLPEDARVIENTNLDIPSSNLDSEESKAYFDIPFHAVHALLSALEQRDATAALHSRRVADLCVTAARGIMNQVDSYILEVAALLHDIGKISVPDEILTKHGKLTDEEQKLLNFHLRMGVETVSTSFNSSELIGIMKYSSAWYQGTPGQPDIPTGDNIPIRSRIIAVASAYDNLITDSVYSEGITPEQAIEALREKAGSQFDPMIVERIAEVITARAQERAHELPDEADIKALRIGLELEKLICAVEEEDILLMSKIAESLAKDAANLEVRNISESAKILEAAIEKGQPFMELVPLVNNIITSASRE